MIPTDPRLLDPVLLSLGAMLAKKHKVEEPKRTVTVRILYEAGPNGEPPEWGESYEYVLPPEARLG